MVFSKWIEAYRIPDFSAATLADKIVKEFFSRLGTPLELHSDQGRNYELQLFAQVCTMLDIHKTRTPPYQPSSNGMIERFNSTLVDMISKYVDENQKTWDQYLTFLQLLTGPVSMKGLTTLLIWSCWEERCINQLTLSSECQT